MPKRGRKPTPPEAKMIAGNPGKRPLTVAQKPPKRGAIAIPDDVAADPVAMSFWEHYTHTTNHLRPPDGPLLGRACIALAIAANATRQWQQTGSKFLIFTPGGAAQQHPLLGIIRNQSELARKYCAEMGLTPAERNRFGDHAPGEDEADEFGL